jgi:prevent-host-death family protein
MGITANMIAVNIAELKNRLSHYLAAVRRGGSVLIRDRNTPIAVIVPIEEVADADDELRTLAAAGRVRLGAGPLHETFWELPAPRVNPDAIRRVLQAERDEP